MKRFTFLLILTLLLNGCAKQTPTENLVDTANQTIDTMYNAVPKECRTDTLTNTRNLIHEADFCRKHCIRRVLRHFCAGNIHHDKTIAAALDKWRIQFAHDFHSVIAVRTNHNSIGMQAIGNRSPLFQELGI